MRKLGFTLLAGVLAAGLVTGTGLSAASAGDAGEAKRYLVAFQSDLPDGYEQQFAGLNARVLRALPEVGGVEVESSDPDFLANLSQLSGIQGANVEMVHLLDEEFLRPKAADGQPVTDIPQPEEIDSYWEYQWDIRRVTGEGASYELGSGGDVDGDGTVTHQAVVGIIDTGIDPDHPDLAANLLGGQNFVPAGEDETETGDPDDIRDRHGHGTHVAGTIAGNGKIKGVGPHLGIRVYRVFPASGGAPTSWIIDAMLQAVEDGVDVINMSLGGYDAIARYKYQGTGNYSDVADMLLWRRAVQYAIDHGVTVVAAAGNESLNLNNPKEITGFLNDTYGYLGLEFQGASMEVPGQIPGVITVSSSIQWSTSKLAFYSNYGSRSIDVAAPGGDNGPAYDETGDLNQRDFHYRTLSTWPTYLEPYFTANLRGYALLHGTSMAAPKVAGIAGVIKAANPGLSPAQVTALIKQSAVDFGKNGTDQLFGAGEANAYEALKELGE